MCSKGNAARESRRSLVSFPSRRRTPYGRSIQSPSPLHTGGRTPAWRCFLLAFTSPSSHSSICFRQGSNLGHRLAAGWAGGGIVEIPPVGCWTAHYFLGSGKQGTCFQICLKQLRKTLEIHGAISDFCLFFLDSSGFKDRKFYQDSLYCSDQELF